MLVLTLPSVGLLDGLLQHPATSPWLGDRLGPKAVADPRGSARVAPEGPARTSSTLNTAGSPATHHRAPPGLPVKRRKRPSS